MRRGLGLSLTMVLALLASTVPASAQACTDSGTPVNFGTYTGTLLNSVGTVTVTCKGNVAWQLRLDAGLGVGATVTTRNMTGPAGAKLNYGLFQDSARTINFDNLSGTGNGSAQPFSTYGQVAAGQFVIPGLYTDTITATVTASGNSFPATFTVNATVQATCLVSATAMAFGTYSTAAVTSTSVLSFTCTNTTLYTVSLSAGLATGATVTNRSMTGPASALLGYKLFSDSGRTINWGNTVGINTVAGVGNGASQSLTVYGQIPAGQFVRPGSYADTITATVTY